MAWSKDTRAPENAGITIKGVPVDIQNEDRFAPVGAFAYSPLAQELFSVDNGVLALLVVYLAKKNPAMLERIINKYLDNVTDLLSDIVESGKTHPLSAINAHTTFAVVAHRFGIINDAGYLKIVDQTRSIIDKIVQLNAADIAGSGMLTGLEVFAGGGKRSRGGIAKLANLKAFK